MEISDGLVALTVIDVRGVKYVQLEEAYRAWRSNQAYDDIDRRGRAERAVDEAYERNR